MAVNTKKALSILNPRSVWLPVVLGLGIVAFIFIRDVETREELVNAIPDISWPSLVVALLILFFKDLANIFRIQTLSAGDFCLKSALYVVLLWEFAIAVTPPIIGATAVLVFIMLKEGLSFGKALAYTLLAAVLDNLFFLTASPIAIWLSDGAVIPENNAVKNSLGNSLSYFFYLSYGLIAFYTLFMASALVLFPQGIRKLLMGLFSLKYLRKAKEAVKTQADDLVLASKVLRKKTALFWIKLLLFTYVVWIAKYAVVNALAAGFVSLDFNDHLLLLGRHVIMWVVMLVSPTPGSSGAAELIFPAFYGDYLGKYAVITSMLWRLLTYYPYLIVGALLLPRWIKRAFKKG